MENIPLTRLLSPLILSSLFLFSCGFQRENETIEIINTSEVQEIISSDENAIILDVRTPEEYKLGHIEGAININIYDEDFADQVAELDREKTYIIHCAANVANGRSDKSLQLMKDLGFAHLKSMEGGFNAWSKDSLKVTLD